MTVTIMEINVRQCFGTSGLPQLDSIPDLIILSPMTSEDDTDIRKDLRKADTEVPRLFDQRYVEIPQITLKVSKAKVRDLRATEGTAEFAFWFISSAYFPIFTACVCPLTNMISISALVTSWRAKDGESVHDQHSVYIFNALSLAFGVVSNVSVVLNFGRKLNYKVSQVLSISGFFVASALLLTGVLLTSKRDMGETEGSAVYTYTEGFWFAVLTIILYFLCWVSCLVNFSGYLLGKYPPDFNLERSERGLIIYTFVMAVWLSWGAALFAHLISDVNYTNGLYFCVQSLLTIGLGDIHPVTNVARALTLLYSFTGFIIMGLIIAMIRSMITSSNTPILLWNQIEMRRKKAVKKLIESEIQVSHRTSFELMRAVRRRARFYQRNINTIITLVVWVFFWLLGALVFYFTEEWTYFEAVYFCFLCLLTIGYGDLAPVSAAGRCFFVVWAISAVPMMTTLISNIGDRVYELQNHDFSSSSIYQHFNMKTNKKKEPNPLSILEHDVAKLEDIDFDEPMSVHEAISRANSINSPCNGTAVKAEDLIEHLRSLIVESKTNPGKKYGYDEWHRVIDFLELNDSELTELGVDDSTFWIGENSPLRYPINEPDYIIFVLVTKLHAQILKEHSGTIDSPVRQSGDIEADHTSESGSIVS